MARTTDALVKGILEVETADDTTPFITVANELVTECCSGGSHTVARLTLIETWLAAHIYTIKEGRPVFEKADEVSEKKQSAVDLGFNSSHYGQMAMRLDTEGNLSELNNKILKGVGSTVALTWLGTENPVSLPTT